MNVHKGTRAADDQQNEGSPFKERDLSLISRLSQKVTSCGI